MGRHFCIGDEPFSLGLIVCLKVKPSCYYEHGLYFKYFEVVKGYYEMELEVGMITLRCVFLFEDLARK